MKRMVVAVLAMLLGVGMTLAAVLILLRATLYIEQMNSPPLRAVAIVATLCLGMVLLLGSVYLSMRLAVRIFGRRESPPRP